jgi:hypothetical protein
MATGQKMAESGYVYVIYDPDVPAVKIGKAKDVQRRLKTFLTANYNLELIGVLPGYTKLEKELHRRFEWAKIDREWFHPVPEILAIARSGQHQPKARPPRREARRSKPKRRQASDSNVRYFIALLVIAWVVFVISNLRG